MDSFPPRVTIWQANPNLKRLLLVLIIVFLFSGIGLSVFAAVQNYQSAKVPVVIPNHQATKVVLPDGRLRVDSPKEGDSVGQTFTVSGYAQDWFEGNISIKVLDSNKNFLYKGSAIAEDNYDHPAPFSLQITLAATSTTATGTIEFDDYSAKDGSLVYQKIENIGFADFGISTDKTGQNVYKNDQYGFEFESQANLNVADDKFVYNPKTSDNPAVGLIVNRFVDLPKTITDAEKQDCPASDPHCIVRSVTQQEYILLKQAIANKNLSYIKNFYKYSNTDLHISFINGGILNVRKSGQTGKYEVEFDIFDKANDFISLVNMSMVYDNFDQTIKTPGYQIIQKISETFKFTK